MLFAMRKAVPAYQSKYRWYCIVVLYGKRFFGGQTVNYENRTVTYVLRKDTDLCLRYYACSYVLYGIQYPCSTIHAVHFVNCGMFVRRNTLVCTTRN